MIDGRTGTENPPRHVCVREHSKVLPIDIDIALGSAGAWIEISERSKRLKKKNSPALANAVILAAARATEAKLLSGDPHLSGLAETIWVKD